MTHDDFVANSLLALRSAIEHLQSGDADPQDGSVLAWKIIDDWKALEGEPDAAYANGEELMWAAVWTMQHICDEEHAKDGTMAKDLDPLLKLLRSSELLPPPGHIARRPE